MICTPVEKKKEVICPSPPSSHKSYSKISFASLATKEDLYNYESSPRLHYTGAKGRPE